MTEGLRENICAGPCRKLIPPHKEKRKSFGNGVTERNEIKERYVLLLLFLCSFCSQVWYASCGIKNFKDRNLRDQTSCTSGWEKERERKARNRSYIKRIATFIRSFPLRKEVRSSWNNSMEQMKAQFVLMWTLIICL